MNSGNPFKEILRYRNAYFMAFSAAAGGICFGWDIGLIGGVLALPSFKHYFGLDKESGAAQASFNGNIVSILQAGGIFGAVVSTWLAGRCGRKCSLLVAAIIFIIGSVMQSIVGLGSTPAFGLKILYLGRFVGGAGLGFIIAIIPTYIAECAPRAIRGRCSGSIELLVGLGNMLSFWVNYSVAVQIPAGQIQWRLPIIAQAIPGVLFFVLMLFQPESPRWLVGRRRYDEAADSLAYIMRIDPSSPAIKTTIAEIRTDFEDRHELSMWAQIRKMGERKAIAYRCFIPSCLTFFLQWSGTNAINYYSPQIFASLGISSTSALLFATGIYGVVKFAFTIIVFAFVIDSWGRKRMLFYGGLGQGLTMLWIGGYAAIHPHPTVVPATYVTIVAIYLYGMSFCLGWGFVPQVLGAEVAPSHLRQATMALAAAVSLVFSYVIAQVTPQMLAKITWGTYIVFCAACMTMTVYVWVGVPETMGLPLEDIKWLFEGSCARVLVRFMQDAPGGRWFLGTKHREYLEELKKKIQSRVVVDEALMQRESNAPDREIARGKRDDPLII